MTDRHPSPDDRPPEPEPSKELVRDQRKIRQTRKNIRLEKAVTMRSRGAGWSEIAQECGFNDAKAASSSVHAYLRKLARQSDATIESHRQSLLESLDQLEKEAWKVLETKHVAHSAGEIVRRYNDETEQFEDLEDDAPTLNAIDRLLKIYERKAKMLGLDLTADTNIGIAVQHTINGVNIEDLR